MTPLPLFFSLLLSLSVYLLVPRAIAYPIPTDPPSLALTALYSTAPPSEVDALTYHLSTHYPAWHRAHRDTARRLIYRFNTTQPGLGDRFRGLFTAYLAAAFSHRVLLLDWEYPFSVFDYLTPSAHMQVRYDPPRDAARNGSVFRCVSRGACATHTLAPFLGPVDTIVLSNSELAHAHFVPMLMRLYPSLPLSLALRNVQVFPSDARLFTRLFAAMFNAEASVQALARRQEADATGTGTGVAEMVAGRRPFVAVHARLGEGVGERKGRFALGDKAVMAKCMARAAVRTAKRQKVRRVFLATDTPMFAGLFEREVVRLLPGARVVGGGEERPVHTANCGKGRSGAEKSCAQTFLELLVLARGEALVGSKSGFSEVASYIGNVGDYSVVDLKKCNEGQ